MDRTQHKVLTDEEARKLGEHIIIPGGYTEIGNKASYSRNMNAVYIPEGVTTIGDCAFHFCENLEYVNIPKSVTHIGKNAFDKCNRLKTITIPADTISIGEAAFCNKGLQWIEVDENNPYYSSQDGILFNKDKTVLITYPSQRKCPFYLVPSSVTEIADCAFGWADIGHIFIPASVTKIGDDAFFRDHCHVDMNNPAYSSKNGYLFNKDQTYLIDVPRGTDKIFIPKSVDRINLMIFEACDPLKFIIYCYANSYGHKFAEENEFHFALIDGGVQTQIHIEVNVWERTIQKR
ncbi:leucine-rich repeat domain-containing protein [Paenibacillus odorifer]|uniref:leucine-rich repeat domain-containing protein n=1 Tax=Paenibacillus odorifer TaxID=189426 RepID=UPI00096DAD55|nr:leucine-rich repeat domain-containing protein [Paenibacillus odorifer]OMD86491.1 hypothetical protein BSK67_28260 [Paenibacillus odorifer]